MSVDLDARYKFAIELVREAGRLGAEHRRNLGPLEAKNPMDYATVADHAVEALIRERVAARFGDAVIGEEDGGSPASVVWVVDPIDGTTNYIHGSPRWCVSLGLLVDGVPEIGVIDAPDENRFFAARRGHGAFENGKPIRVSNLRHGASPVIEAGWSPRRALAAYTTMLTRLIGDGIEFRRLGSGALGMVDVACGRVDGYVELHINAWDVLAAMVLVREAGGWLNGFLDNDGLMRGNPIIACTPEITHRLTAAMEGLSG